MKSRMRENRTSGSVRGSRQSLHNRNKVKGVSRLSTRLNIMDENFIRKRMTELRMKKGVSEYQMSLDMGHSRNYIQNISNGRALPSMPEFLYMCEYLEVTPSAFFDESTENPALMQKAIDELRTLPDRDVLTLLGLIQRLKER